MVEFEIRENACFSRSKLTKTSLIASNLPYDDMSANLLDFLSSFDDKLSHFSVSSFNFLARTHRLSHLYVCLREFMAKVATLVLSSIVPTK